MITPYMKRVGIKTKIVPHGHWSSRDENNRFTNRVRFVELLGEILGYTNVEDWYKVKQRDAYEFGGNGLLVKYYSGSIQQLIQETYPNYWFIPWLFQEAPNRYWELSDNIELYIDWLASMKNYTTLNDLYKLRTEDFKLNKGMGLVAKFKQTIIKIYEHIYPEKEWYPFMFEITTMGSLKDKKTHRQYLKHLEEVLGISSPEQWYNKCNKSNISENGCPGLLAYYNKSPTQYIYTMYPDYPWKWYKFSQCSHGEWDKKEKVKEWFDDLLIHHNITDYDDVYKLNRTDILNFYGGGGVDRYKGYIKLITENIPYNWDIKKFIKYGYSKKAVNLLNRLSAIIGIDIRHIHSSKDGEKKIGRYSADGYITAEQVRGKYDLPLNIKGIVIEYHGCCFHGCPKCYPTRSEKTFFGKKTYEECYIKTNERKRKMEADGYLVLELWECEDTELIDLGAWFQTIATMSSI